jgi:hypothetical protein
MVTMAKIAVQMNIDYKHLEALAAFVSSLDVEAVVFCRLFEKQMLDEHTSSIEELAEQHQPGITAWGKVRDLATKEPKPLRYFAEELLKHGVAKGSIYNAITRACEKRVIRKTTIKGVPHFVREKMV